MSKRVPKQLRPVQQHDAPCTQLRPGVTVAYSYRVIRELASGGMSQLYMVEHLPSGSHAALKLAAVPGRGILAREHALLGRVKHSNIITAYECGQLFDAREYLVVELIPGADLAAWLSTFGTLNPARAISVLWQLASAVDHLHAAGVVHSDIKPSNIMLNVHGEHVTLIDFGVAFDFATERAQRGSTGTPGYMAPEQLRGEGCGPAADRYAVAAVALELLGLSSTASRTRNLTNSGTRSSNKTHAVAEPSVPGGGMTPAMRGVFQRALHQAPTKRYPTARAFVSALVRCASVESQARAVHGHGTRGKARAPRAASRTPAASVARDAARSS